MSQARVTTRFLDVGEDPNKTLPPLEGYAKKDLLSITEAIKLITLDVPMHNIDSMVWTAKRSAREPKDGLTSDELASIYLYTLEWPEGYDSFYKLLNQKLRSKQRKHLKPWFSYLKLFLTGLYKLPSIRKNIWRGIPGNVSHLYEKDCIWWGFSSCTGTMATVEQFFDRSSERTLFLIECINGKDIKAYSAHDDENEILLMPGAYFTVIDKYSPADNLYIVHLREESPPYQLLEPPFDLTSVNTTTVLPKSQAASEPTAADIINLPCADLVSCTTSNDFVNNMAISASKKKKSDESTTNDKKDHEVTTSNNSKSNQTTKTITRVKSTLPVMSSSFSAMKVTKTDDGKTSAQPKSSQLADNTVTDKVAISTKSKSTKGKQNPVSDGSPFHADKTWLDIQFHDKNKNVKQPDELENEMNVPSTLINDEILNRIQGSMIGMALGDALGAHVEFRPHQFLVDNPVKDLESGGTWGLEKGQFTDDTSMALCLANSLVACHGFNAYDQLVRYKWWYKFGYMSATGRCFDIGTGTRQSLLEFERRQNIFAKKFNTPFTDMDRLSDSELLQKFDVYCSDHGVAGNGALTGLAPVPLFFYREPPVAVEYSGVSGQITHGDTTAYDACRYYGALIVAALQGYEKEQLLDDNFYQKHKEWFSIKRLHHEIESISRGSYKKSGYDAGIRGKGYIVNALEAALWAFWSDDNSFEKGALAAVNLGDDTDTTAAIYGQLAGAHYGYRNLPERWLEHLYAKKFMEKLSKWIAYEGECWQK
ncbi:unnamed protein product [Rotaria magnacalcarata]